MAACRPQSAPSPGSVTMHALREDLIEAVPCGSSRRSLLVGELGMLKTPSGAFLGIVEFPIKRLYDGYRDFAPIHSLG